MNNISMFWNALRAGEILSNPTKWKDRQNTINAISAVLGLLLWILAKSGLVLELSGDEVSMVAGGFAVVLGTVNGYLTTATTKKDLALSNAPDIIIKSDDDDIRFGGVTPDTIKKNMEKSNPEKLGVGD